VRPRQHVDRVDLEQGDGIDDTGQRAGVRSGGATIGEALRCEGDTSGLGLC
jgi:hypothetical protein